MPTVWSTDRNGAGGFGCSFVGATETPSNERYARTSATLTVESISAATDFRQVLVVQR